MSSVRCGIDITEISRIENATLKNGRFCERVFTGCEMEYFNSHGKRLEILAGFFAAKEAFSKYLGTGIRGFEFRDIEVCHDKLGSPFILFKGRKIDCDLSISHSGDTAVAVVCGAALGSWDNVDIETRRKMKKLIPLRHDDANKCDCGRLFIIAGSKGMTGAAALCAYGALRSGAGLVTAGTAESEQMILACKLTEAMTLPLSCSDGKIDYRAMSEIWRYAEKSDVVAIGPGLGRSGDLRRILEELVSGYNKTMIIDADGINALSENINILEEKQCGIVLTPHVGEMSRLCGLTAEEIQADREGVARDFAIRHGVCLVLSCFLKNHSMPRWSLPSSTIWRLKTKLSRMANSPKNCFSQRGKRLKKLMP